MRLLAAADLHIGRRSPDLPAAESAEVSCAAAWWRLADEAARLQVAAVLLSGDLLDAATRYYEAAHALDEGLATLRRHGIWTFAVAGNHDALLLAEFARGNAARPASEQQFFRLLGAGGTWERADVTCGSERVAVVGWSFPSTDFRGDPLATFPDTLRGLAPALGLLHGDRNGANSPYAPFAEKGLEATGIGTWLLGHVHKPDPLDRPLCVYPGSLQGLDAGPGECGLHGPLLITVDEAGHVERHRHPIAPLRYEALDLDLGAVPDAEAFREALNDALTRWAASLDHADGLRHLVVRPCLRCVSSQRADELGALVDELWSGAGALGCGDRRVWLHEPLLEVRPPVVLDDLAHQLDLRGALARLIRELDGTAPRSADTDRLLASVGDAARLLQLDGALFHDVEREHRDAEPEPAESLLRRQAWALLGRLIEQKREEVRR